MAQNFSKMKLGAFETSLFSATARTEKQLLELDSTSKQLAVDLWLHIPTMNPSTCADMFKMYATLSSETSDKDAQNIASVYGKAYQRSWQKSSRPALMERIKDSNTPKPQLSKLLLEKECIASDNEKDTAYRDLIEAMSRIQTANEPPENKENISALDDQHIKISATPRILALSPKKQMSDFGVQVDILASIPSKIQQDDVIIIDDAPPYHNDESRKHEKRKRHRSSTSKESSDDESPNVETRSKDFMTAKQYAIKQDTKKNSGFRNQEPQQSVQQPKKTLGGQRRRFVPPMKKEGHTSETAISEVSKRVFGNSSADSNNSKGSEEIDERLKNIDPKMIETIQNEIMDTNSDISWDDIAGLHHAKKSIQEAVIWPMQRPDIFTGLRRAPRGILLFGPPGTGKTMIGKCIASNAGCTFFSISASSLTSKWVGEGEKMVRALFAVARVHQPSVIFIDEIDSLLTQRTDGEFEASRRIKTEFLIQFDGAHVSKDDDHILVIGATNRPQEIDEAARRRLIKRYYIPLPDPAARECIVKTLLKKQKHSLNDNEIAMVGENTKGYSGSDMDGLCREAALCSIREIPPEQIKNIPLDQVRPINFKDFDYALRQVRASVSDRDLELYRLWNDDYGSLPNAVEKEI